MRKYYIWLIFCEESKWKRRMKEKQEDMKSIRLKCKYRNRRKLIYNCHSICNFDFLHCSILHPLDTPCLFLRKSNNTGMSLKCADEETPYTVGIDNACFLTRIPKYIDSSFTLGHLKSGEEQDILEMESKLLYSRKRER